jgi:REP element-mobilizing transposase RayT
VHFQGAVYHVLTRGALRTEIFKDDEDRRTFMRLLLVIAEQSRASVRAYCLMGNHVHLLIQVADVPLSRIMHRLLGTYAQVFNERHERTGHLFESRYKALVCLSDRYLANLILYIHRNPVRAGLVDRPDKWAWSSCRGENDEEPPEGFNPWEEGGSECLLREELDIPPALDELSRRYGGPEALRARSKAPALVQKRRLFAREASHSGFANADIGRWLRLGESAIRFLLRNCETAGQAPGVKSGRN